MCHGYKGFRFEDLSDRHRQRDPGMSYWPGPHRTIHDRSRGSPGYVILVMQSCSRHYWYHTLSWWTTSVINSLDEDINVIYPGPAGRDWFSVVRMLCVIRFCLSCCLTKQRCCRGNWWRYWICSVISSHSTTLWIKIVSREPQGKVDPRRGSPL